MWYALCKWLFECELLSARPSLQTQGWKPLTHKVFSMHQAHRKHISFQETGPEQRISWISLQASFSTACRLAWVAAQTACTWGKRMGRFSQHRDGPRNEVNNTSPLAVVGEMWRCLGLNSNWPQINSGGYESLTHETNEQTTASVNSTTEGERVQRVESISAGMLDRGTTRIYSAVL